MAIPTEGNTTVMIDSNSIVVNPTSKLDIPQAVTLSQVLTRDTTIDGTAMSSIRVIEADDSSGLAIFSTEASYSATDGRQCRIFVFNTDSSDYVSLDISANGYVKLTNAYFIVDTPVQSGHATNK